jgi:hypothetical protein
MQEKVSKARANQQNLRYSRNDAIASVLPFNRLFKRITANENPTDRRIKLEELKSSIKPREKANNLRNRLQNYADLLPNIWKLLADLVE